MQWSWADHARPWATSPGFGGPWSCPVLARSFPCFRSSAPAHRTAGPPPTPWQHSSSMYSSRPSRPSPGKGLPRSWWHTCSAQGPPACSGTQRPNFCVWTSSLRRTACSLPRLGASTRSCPSSRRPRRSSRGGCWRCWSVSLPLRAACLASWIPPPSRRCLPWASILSTLPIPGAAASASLLPSAPPPARPLRERHETLSPCTTACAPQWRRPPPTMALSWRPAHAPSCAMLLRSPLIGPSCISWRPQPRWSRPCERSRGSGWCRPKPWQPSTAFSRGRAMASSGSS
mmetsp:Transcript_66904/g.118758  ORF Transcript_66904/g.118758 Transcript_66904/m.118758 type:complete len:287 (-) Transcript_66904:3226-4086(-)